MKILMAAALAGVALARSPAAAQTAPAASSEEKVNQLIVYGDDPCPRSEGDEITVCARKPEGERFRIPSNLRNDPNDRGNETWAARASELQYVGASGIGSCSPTGPGGFTGCFNQIVRQARADRAKRDEINWNKLIEEARRERLSGIDAAAAAEEADSADSPH